MRRPHICKPAAAALAAFLLASCSAVTGFLADKGNKYCEVRPDSADSVIEDINKDLAEAGAKFEVNGLTCLSD